MATPFGGPDPDPVRNLTGSETLISPFCTLCRGPKKGGQDLSTFWTRNGVILTSNIGLKIRGSVTFGGPNLIELLGQIWGGDLTPLFHPFALLWFISLSVRLVGLGLVGFWSGFCRFLPKDDQ